MKKTSILLLITILFLTKGYSQNGYFFDDLNYAPTTPEVSSFGKYIETPVSLYTGQPKISIDIGSITSGNLSANVSLNYHSSGVKIQEYASWVGTNWTLDAGGYVSRVVRGMPDDGQGGFINTIKTVDDFLALPHYEGVTERINLIQQSLNGDLDYEADLYYYSFSGYSGGFIMNQQGDVILVPHSEVVIEKKISAFGFIEGWEITAPNGTKGYFGVSKDGNRQGHEEIISSVSLTGGKNRGQGYITGWNLMDLTDFTGENNIIYTYIDNYYSTCDRSGQQRYIVYSIDCSSFTGGIKPAVFYQNNIKSSKIYSIKGEDGEIIFTKSETQRQDLPNDYALSQIKVINNSNEEIKKYDLLYQYKQSLGSGTQIPCSGSERFYRLFLKSIQMTSGNLTQPPYLFEYNNTFTLPDRYSNAQDFWGYFNNKISNQHLIPSMSIYGTFYSGANRYTNKSAIKSGVLEKVKYPIGGYTEFEYEANTIGQSAYASLLANRINTSILSISQLDLNYTNYTATYHGTFSINNNNTIGDKVEINVDFPCDVTDSNCGILFQLKKDDNTFSVYLSQNTTLLLESGFYEVIGTVFPNNQEIYPEFFIHISGEQYEDSINNYSVGGLRVRSIKNFSKEGVIESQKHYTYNNFNNVNSTSGAITSAPSFVELNASMSTYGMSNCFNIYCHIIHSYSKNALSTTQGSYVGYRFITEYFGDERSNVGKIEYEFSFNLDDDSPNYNAYEFPFVPPKNLEWMRGKLLQKTIYSKNGGGSGGYQKQREDIYDYKYYRNPNDIFNRSITSIKMASRLSVSDLSWNTYQTISEWFYLDKIITRNHLQGGVIEDIKTFVHHENEQKHIMPIKEIYTINGNEEIEISNFYPQDLLPHTQMQNLVDQNRISQPIKVTKKVNGTPVQTTNTVYATNTNTSGKTQPVIIQADKGGGTNLENRINYDRYDNKGNPLQVSMASGPKISYIWGYNNQYPVAKIENIAYNTIPSQLITNIKNASNSGTETQMRNALNALRNDAALSGAMVTTYMYKPLVGITRMIDPKGDEIRYFYDAFGRLDHIKDKQGNFLEEYEYNYREND